MYVNIKSKGIITYCLFSIFIRDKSTLIHFSLFWFHWMPENVFCTVLYKNFSLTPKAYSMQILRIKLWIYFLRANTGAYMMNFIIWSTKNHFHSMFKAKVKTSIVKYFDILYIRMKGKLVTAGLSSRVQRNLINKQELMVTYVSSAAIIIYFWCGCEK